MIFFALDCGKELILFSTFPFRRNIYILIIVQKTVVHVGYGSIHACRMCMDLLY